MSTEEEFETIYEEARCQCGDEVMEWEWNPDEIHFESTCGCLKRHCIKPIKCQVKIESEEGFEEDYD